MKKLVFLLTILMYSYANAQCVKLYINEYLDGSPICYLSEGDYIELCLNDKEVNGCPRDLYIYDMGYYSGSQTYELSLDKGWSTHYMTLMVNTTTKRFAFILQGQTALYSYYTENDWAKMQKIYEKKQEDQRREQNIANEKKLLEDKKKYAQLDAALTSDNFDLFRKLISNLYFPRSYPNYKAFEKMEEVRKQQEDIILLDKIDSLISRVNTNNFKGSEGNVIAESLKEDEKITNEIINLYSGLNFQSQETKLEIASKVKEKFSGNFVYLKDAWQNKKICEVLSCAIKVLDRGIGGVHELFIKQNGEVLIDDVLIENCFAEPWSYTMSEDSNFEITLGIKSKFYITDQKYKLVFFHKWLGLSGERQVSRFKEKFEIEGLPLEDGFSFKLKKNEEDTLTMIDILAMSSHIVTGDMSNFGAGSTTPPGSGRKYYHGSPNYNKFSLVVGIWKRTENSAKVAVVLVQPKNVSEYVQKYRPLQEFIYPIVSEVGAFKQKQVYIVGDLW